MKKLLGLLAIAPLTLSACGSKEVEVKSNEVVEVNNIDKVREDAIVMFSQQADLICYEIDLDTFEVIEAFVWYFEETLETNTDGEEFYITYTENIGEYQWYEGWFRNYMPPVHTYIYALDEVVSLVSSWYSYCD